MPRSVICLGETPIATYEEKTCILLLSLGRGTLSLWSQGWLVVWSMFYILILQLHLFPEEWEHL